MCKVFGEMLTTMRLSRNMSLDMLAARSELAKSTVWGAEEGADIALSTVAKLAKGFGVSTSTLVKRWESDLKEHEHD